MQRRHVPGLNREVSAIGAGCWTIGGLATNQGIPIGWSGVDEDEAFAALVHAHDLGVTLYDTADVYGLGRSERLIGRFLKRVTRERLVVSSKVGYFAGTAAHPYAAGQVRRQFLTTLDNLGTDYLDLYFLHSSDFGPGDCYLDQALDTFQRLRQQGMIRAVGMRAPHEFAEEWAAQSGHPKAAQAARFLTLFDRIRPDVLTARHNLLSPLYTPAETDIFTFAARHGTGVIIKQALGQGLLTGPHASATPRRFPPGDHRATDPTFTAPFLTAVNTVLDTLGGRFGTTPADRVRIALQYVLHADQHAPALVGFRNTGQINSNITGLGDPLTTEEIGEIRAALSPLREMLSPNPPTDQQEISRAVHRG